MHEVVSLGTVLQSPFICGSSAETVRAEARRGPPRLGAPTTDQDTVRVKDGDPGMLPYVLNTLFFRSLMYRVPR